MSETQIPVQKISMLPEESTEERYQKIFELVLSLNHGGKWSPNTAVEYAVQQYYQIRSAINNEEYRASQSVYNYECVQQGIIPGVQNLYNNLGGK